MKEDKTRFAKLFHKLISENTREYSDVVDIVYTIDSESNEWLYIIYESGSQRRVNVSCSSCSAMMTDFFEQIHKAEWLNDSQKINLGAKKDEEGNDYYVTIRIDGRYDVPVKALDIDEAKKKAENLFEEVDLGDLTDIPDWYPVAVHDSEGNILWD